MHFLFSTPPGLAALPRPDGFFSRRVFRPEDACKKRFSWSSDWNPKVQKYSFLPKTHKCTSCRSRKFSNEYLLLSIYMYLLANIGFDISENGPLKVCHQLGNYLSNS